jgi:hypothetical protein
MLQHLWHDVIFGFRSTVVIIPAPAEPRGVTQAQHARLAQIELPIGQEPPEDGVKQGELENWENLGWVVVESLQNLGEFALVPQNMGKCMKMVQNYGICLENIKKNCQPNINSRKTPVCFLSSLFSAGFVPETNVTYVSPWLAFAFFFYAKRPSSPSQMDLFKCGRVT